MLSSNTPDLSYRRLVAKNRRSLGTQSVTVRRIAILSDAASQPFIPVLRALMAENGLGSSFYEGAFDAIELEVFNSDSGLYSFEPDTILLAFSIQAFRSRYYQSPSERAAEPTIERIRQIWRAIRSRTSAQIIHCNYVMPQERFFGNFDLQVPHSLYAVTRRINTEIAFAASQDTGVAICDVEGIAAQIGVAAWFDDRMWNMAKAFCRLDYLPVVCQNVVEIILSTMGRVTKCLVLDLDNTLWGGFVGDLGCLGIAIGAHGEGEAFYHFQNYLLGLKRRGIILAVCSKNNLEDAIEPFTSNPNMVLKLEDIAVVKANWSNKADNIHTISDQLNIAPDSMVFLDDSPFERNMVRQLMPAVIVPELPKDPAEFVSFLSGLNLFEVTSFSLEDAARTDLYRQEAKRLRVRETFSDVDDYLESLEMHLELCRFDRDNLNRISQLTQRSNQFNVTTRRLSEADCNQMMMDTEHWLPLYASLADRFGDHGLIALVILKCAGDTLSITDWLMSCRVFSRGVEEALMNFVMSTALRMKILKVQAEYIPTAKNAIVRDLFARSGFDKLADEDGHTRWTLKPGNYKFISTHITKVIYQGESIHLDSVLQ